MSGHSKWSKIKHQKAVVDVKKSKEFSKFAQLIAAESKKASGNKNVPGLRKAIERARAINMPTLNIERAIKKGTEKDAASLEEATYEAYGPGGSALIIQGLTSNKNRASAEIKHILSKHEASLAERGAASWAFGKKEGQWIPKTTIPLSQDDNKKLEILVEKLKENDNVQEVYTNLEK